MIKSFPREHYCFFVVRHAGTKHVAARTTRHDSHDTSCWSCRGVTQQVKFWLMRKGHGHSCL